MSQVVVEDPLELIGCTLADRFRIEQRIAEGGFGVVYRAWQLALDRPVAVKVLKTPPRLDDAARAVFREKFASEAKTIARLRHPHIVDVYDYGVMPTRSGELAPWMALEWLDGETLDAQLNRRCGSGGRSAVEAVNLLRPVIEAVAYAHKMRIVHRDIKPANIMVVQGERRPSLRVLDFGIAKIMDLDGSIGSGQTQTTGLPAFSPAYAAPEQVTFSRTGPWTDVHAVALVLSEMMTDAPPFSAPDLHVFEQVMSPQRPTPRANGKDVGSMETVLAKALAISPGERYRDAGELLEAIDRALEAVAPPRADRLAMAPTRQAEGAAPAWKERRRARSRTVAVAVVLLVLGGAAAAITLSRPRPPSAFRPQGQPTATSQMISEQPDRAHGSAGTTRHPVGKVSAVIEGGVASRILLCGDEVAQQASAWRSENIPYGHHRMTVEMDGKPAETRDFYLTAETPAVELWFVGPQGPIGHDPPSRPRR